VKGNASATPITSVNPGSTPISRPMTIPVTSIAILSGVRQ
jgi:hypothetical protein